MPSLKKSLSTLLFFFVLPFYGQNTITVPVGTSKKDFDFILAQQKNFGSDIKSAERYLAPLKNSHLKVHHCLYHVLYATAYEQHIDRMSPVAEENFEKALHCKHSEAVQAWAKISYAKYLYKYRDYQRQVPILTDAMFLLETLPEKEIIQPGESFQFIGYVMQTLKDYEESIYFLKKSNHFLPQNSTALSANLDNIGNSYLQLNNYSTAKAYYERALRKSEEIKDYERIAKVSGNLGDLYFRQKKYDKAIQLLQKDIEISRNLKLSQNLMYASTLISKVYLAAGKTAEAEKFLNEALTIATTKDYFKSSEYEILQMKLKLANLAGNNAEELKIYKRLKQVEVDLASMDSDENTYKANWEVRKLQYKKQLAKSEKLISKESFLKKSAVTSTVVVITAGLIIFIFLRNKMKRLRIAYEEKVNFFEQEKEQYENSLKNSEKGIADQISFIREKNKQIQKLTEEIEKLGKTRSYQFEQSHGKLNKLLESHLMTDENWKQFKEEFYLAYPEIQREVYTNYADLSESYLRIAFLQKLGFSNNEISGLLGITADAVKKSKQRLKRKLEDRYENFTALINSGEIA